MQFSKQSISPAHLPWTLCSRRLTSPVLCLDSLQLHCGDNLSSPFSCALTIADAPRSGEGVRDIWMAAVCAFSVLLPIALISCSCLVKVSHHVCLDSCSLHGSAAHPNGPRNSWEIAGITNSFFFPEYQFQVTFVSNVIFPLKKPVQAATHPGPAAHGNGYFYHPWLWSTPFQQAKLIGH